MTDVDVDALENRYQSWAISTQVTPLETLSLLGDYRTALRQQQADYERVSGRRLEYVLENARLRAAIEGFPNQRESFHITYNGGHHEEETNKAFHHGMDTVFNALDEWKRKALEKKDG